MTSHLETDTKPKNVDRWSYWQADDITCPHCGFAQDDHTDYPLSLANDGDREDVECDSCGKPFRVELWTTFRYTSTIPTPIHT